jgi:ribosomal protein S18 acetylase RimI-like enzyme
MSEFDALLADLDWVLSHFTLAADLTALREGCRFTTSEDALAARYDGLPFPALSFWTQDAAQLGDLAARLVAPAEAFYVLVNERQARLAEQAFAVEQVDLEWQMLFTADSTPPSAGDAVPLGPEDLGAMRDLAAETGLMALEVDPFRHGPAFGVWAAEKAARAPLLVSMGGTHLRVPGAAEIGNIATRSTHRRMGFARRVVSALVQAHVAQEQRVFLMVFQTNQAAVRLYERMGFLRLRPMFLMRCLLRNP